MMLWNGNQNKLLILMYGLSGCVDMFGVFCTFELGNAVARLDYLKVDSCS